MGIQMLAVAFLFPWILAASGAVAAPIVIHLIMRSKPRRIVFPAMRFVRKTHRANISRLRLKHLILLAMRMAAIVLVAVLIARAETGGSGGAGGSGAPAAAVLVVDNTGSMEYRYCGQSRLKHAHRLAAQVIESLPAGSRFAVLSAGDPGAAAGFLSDRGVAAAQLAAVEQTPSHVSLAAAVGRAVELAAAQRMARKEVYIFTDMTAQAWRDGAGAGAARDIRFNVLDCGGGDRANVALGGPRLAACFAAVGTEVALDVVVRSDAISAELPVRVELDGRGIQERSVRCVGGTAVSLSIPLRVTRPGVLHGRVRLDYPDPLKTDNERFFTLLGAPPGEVVIVSDPAARRTRDTAAFLMGAAIDPAGGAGGGVMRRREITADRLDADEFGRARFVILADVSSLSQTQWGLMEDFVRGGGHVWIVPGDLTDPDAYDSRAAQRIMPAAMRSPEQLPAGAGWAAGAAGEPMLAPFAGGGNPPLSEVRCLRRFAIGSTAADARVILRYSDGAPAIVSRSAGRGSVLLWNFSPTRSFSNLAGLAQFPILVQRTARLLAAEDAPETMYLWGGGATLASAGRAGTVVVTLRRPGAEAEEPLLGAVGGPAVTVAADRLGHWDFQLTQGDRQTAGGFSVNADPDESDLRPAEREKVASAFAPQPVVIASDVEAMARDAEAAAEPVDLAPPLLLALLVLLVGESFFANRFYRRAGEAAAP